ncbi:MAG TPA: PP2C family protein-serine/threonine phosphatase [Yinghuangia sp.]|uniref:PP2C family protein-serine/threonine phosphatase n=1 Tax=Yinghuangia sp. YIM S10712 TaxID=3436930 RepID=UPI002C4F5C9D|nr:PP2C family protein-serine/threonine phosphatase [Yinghuangia sp.]
MTAADRLLALHRTLRAAPPHDIVHALARVLADRFRVTSCTLLLADYAVSSLRPFGREATEDSVVPVVGTPAGRAFVAQEPVVVTDGHPGAEETLYLPVSARGDRIGVLRIGYPEQGAKPSVAELSEAAEALAHEILAAAPATDVYRQSRRLRRLTLAAEMQWDLLPGHSCERPEFILGAQLEPAYSVRGDNFDWSVSADTLTVSVTNGMGHGVQAATLTALAVGALRNARRSGADLALQAELASQAVWSVHTGSAYLASVLLEIDLASGEVDGIDAGSPVVMLLRQGRVERVDLEAQFALGMLEDTRYVPERFTLEAGDRLLVVSDGVHGFRSHTGEIFGERQLAVVMRDNRLAPAPEAARAVLRELARFRGDNQADDDAVALCLDWRGRDT